VRLDFPPSRLAERRRQRGRDAQDGLHYLEDRGPGDVLPRPDPDDREGDGEPRGRVPGVRGGHGAGEEKRGEEGEDATYRRDNNGTIGRSK